MTKFLYGISILALSAGLAVAQSNPTDQGQAGRQNSSTPNQTTTTPDNSATAPSSQSSGQTGVSGQSNPSAPAGQSTAPSTSTTPSTTTTTTQSTPTSGQTTSVTGCLQGSSGSFNLTDNNGKSWTLQGDSNSNSQLSQHIGHTVSITGMDNGSGTLQVSSISMISANCANSSGASSNPPGASASAGTGAAAGSAAGTSAQPSSDMSGSNMASS